MQTSFTSVLQALTSSQQQYENANSAKQHFIRYIFHELRVPFNALILGIQQLKYDHDRIAQVMPDVADAIDLMEDQGMCVCMWLRLLLCCYLFFAVVSKKPSCFDVSIADLFLCVDMVCGLSQARLFLVF